MGLERKARGLGQPDAVDPDLLARINEELAADAAAQLTDKAGAVRLEVLDSWASGASDPALDLAAAGVSDGEALPLLVNTARRYARQARARLWWAAIVSVLLAGTTAGLIALWSRSK